MLVYYVKLSYLTHILVTRRNDFIQGRLSYRYAFATGHGEDSGLDLLHTRPMETQVKAVVGQRPNLQRGEEDNDGCKSGKGSA